MVVGFIANTALPSKNLIWHWGVYTELKEKWLSDGQWKVDNTKESIRWKKYITKRKWKRHANSATNRKKAIKPNKRGKILLNKHEI